MKYSLQDSRVLFEGREELSYRLVQIALLNALRRKLILAGKHRPFFRDLRSCGEASITWNFTPFNWRNEKEWVTFQVRKISDAGFQVLCFGPRAGLAVERANKLMDGLVVSRNKGTIQRIRLDNSDQVKRTKKRRKVCRRPKRQIQQGLKRKKGTKVFIPAVLSLQNHQILTPQFRNNRVLWDEAILMTIQSFDVQSNWKYSAREIVSQELFASMQRSGYRFAQFKRAGFCLRFDLIDGIWRGDLTPLTVACTKDNTHRSYRRMRKWLRDKLLGLPSPEQAIRRAIVYGKVAA